MCASPLFPVRPELLVDGSRSERVEQALAALTVHVTGEGRATAEVELSDEQEGAGFAVELGTTTLSLRFAPDETVFVGRVTELETRLPDGAAPSLVVYAEGTAPDSDGAAPPLSLRFGVEIESGSVRGHVGTSAARCVTATRGLRHGGRVELSTPDARFDGPFSVVELWHRLDRAHGVRTEFVAIRGTGIHEDGPS